MWLNNILILLLSLALTACFHSEDEADDGHDHQHKIEGPVNSLTETGFILDAEDGTQVTVVTNEDTRGDDLTGLVAGDYVEVDGTLDPVTNSITATKIETDSDPTDASETLIVVAAGLDKPVVELEVIEVQSSDAHVEVEGVVASVAGNAVVVDITRVEHTTADMGMQMTVMLSDSFIKLGALSDIAVGDEVELKGKLDANNNFVIHVMKVEVADDGLGDDDATTENDDLDEGDTVTEVVSDDEDDDTSTDDADNATGDDDTKVEYSVEVHATVDSVLANILTATTMASDDNTVAADMQMIIDIANVNIFGADLAGLQAGDEVELKGELDDAGNFVVMAVEVESNDDDSHRMQGNTGNGMSTMDQKVSGVVTAVGSDAISLTVTRVLNLSDVVIDSDITIALDLGSKFDDGVMPQVGDTVVIDVNVVPGVGRVAAEVEVKM